LGVAVGSNHNVLSRLHNYDKTKIRQKQKLFYLKSYLSLTYDFTRETLYGGKHTNV